MIEHHKEKKLVSNYIVFDLETTGFDPKVCKIIEIGALKYRNNELVDKFDILINPEIPIPEVITSITGINNDMVKNSPLICEILPKFIEFIEDYPLVAHNAPFDLSFIEQNILNLGLDMIKNTNLDTVLLSRKYIPQAYNHKLETLKKYFHLDYGSHRSIDDCKTTNYIYQYCKNKALVQN